MDKKQSATIEYLGGDETGNAGKVQWGKFTFEMNKPIKCDDPHIVAKARTNRFFKVSDDQVAVVEIPKDWEKMPAKAKVDLSHALGNTAVTTDKEASAHIAAEVERRREAAYKKEPGP